MALIQMKATALHEHRDAVERPTHELALVPGRAWLGEPRDLLVRDAHRIAHGVGHAGEPRAEHDGDLRLELAESLRDDVGRLSERTSPLSPLSLLHSSIPASVADRKFASVPAIIARNPRRARSCFRSGARAPMPPI